MLGLKLNHVSKRGQKDIVCHKRLKKTAVSSSKHLLEQT